MLIEHSEVWLSDTFPGKQYVEDSTNDKFYKNKSNYLINLKEYCLEKFLKNVTFQC